MVNGFLSRGRMGSFQDAIDLAELTGNAADTTPVRQYRSRGGMTVAAEQQIVPNVAVFARAGVANGQIEPYEYSDIDQTVAGGLSLKGKLWGRPDDTFAIAWRMTLDYQFIANPAYNRDRGSVSVIGIRLHTQF